MIDQERLAAIRARLDAATGGNWYRDDASPALGNGSCLGEGASIWANDRFMTDVDVVLGGQHADGRGYGLMRNSDAEFIINAKSDIEWLLECLGEVISE